MPSAPVQDLTTFQNLSNPASPTGVQVGKFGCAFVSHRDHKEMHREYRDFLSENTFFSLCPLWESRKTALLNSFTPPELHSVLYQINGESVLQEIILK